MKHGMFQRSVSLLLALVMILGNVPMNALATETEETTTPVCEHSYEAVTTDATCTADGVVVYTCGCGNTYSETIAATGHTWGEWAIVEEASYEAAGSQTRTCACGASETAQIPQLVHEHSFGEWSVITEATYEAPGSQSRTCACGASETAQIPQLVHEHSFGDWSVVTEATYEAPGAQVRTCECGASETEAIPQLIKEKAELSGEKRKIYFLNTENWEEVYIAWSFDEEDFQDVAFPGEEMEADEVLENVFVVELPVEADAVTFNDGVEVTEELKAYERENGIEAIHFFAAELDAELDYFSAAEQVEDENNATEWLSYEDLHKAWEEAKKAEEDAAKQPVMDNAPQGETTDPAQALIDALPASVNSQEEYDAVYAIVDQLEQAGYIDGLTDEQLARAMDAINAADLWYAGEEAGNYAEEDGWYWDGTTLCIKDGSITKGKLYAALVEKYGSGSYKYAAQKPTLGWDAGGTEVKSGETDSITVSQDSAAAAKQGSTSWKDWTGWGANSTTNTFTVEYYYVVKVAITGPANDGAVSYNGTDYGNGAEFKYFPGLNKDISVAGVTGWNTPTILQPTASGTLEVNYISENTAKHNVTLTVEGDEFAKAAPTLSESGEVEEGKIIIINNTAALDNTDSIKYTVDIKVEGATLNGNTFTVGERDVAVTVTFTKTEIKFGADKNTTIEWNGWYKDGTKLRAEALAELKEKIFTKLDVEGADLAGVNIQYYPWYTTRTQDPGYSDADGLTKLDGSRQDYSVDIPLVGKVGWSFNEFGERGYKDGAKFADTKEKVRITTADGLWIDTEITLTEARGSAPVVNATTAESKDGAAGILAAAKAAAAAAYSGYENLEFAITTENWEATVDGLEAGATTDVTVQATFAGDTDKIGGTVTVTVAVTKSAVLAAEVTCTENVDGGDVALTKGANNAALGNGVMAADNPVHVTVNNFKYGSTNAEAYYLDGISVNGNPLTVANNAASFEVENSVDEVKNYTVVVSYEKETFSIATTGYEIKINGFSNETKSVDLKKLVLDEIFSEGNYNGEDYKVEMKTSYTLDLGELGSYDLAEGYYDVTGYTFNFLGERHLPASWFVGKLNTDGVTLNNFKITKLGSSNRSGKDLYKEDVMIVASEAREETDNITLSDLDYTENTLADVIAAIKNNVRVNGETANVNVTLAPETALTTVKQTYTATVTAPATANYLESSKAFTITAKATAFTVTWIADGVTVDTETVVYGGNATKTPGVPAKEGHTGAWVGNTTNIKTDTGIVANYTANKYTVTWTVNGEAYGEPVEVTYGTAVNAPAYTTPKGHTFSGWAIPETMPAEDITLNATLTVNSYDVIWKWQNAEGEQTTTVTLPYGSAIVVPAEIPLNYKVDNVTYTRTGWTGLVDGATVPVDGITYTATYTTAVAYIVDFDSDGGSEVVDVTITVNEGETATVAKPVDPNREGYRFDGWLLNGEAYDFTTLVTADITLTAKWVKLVTVSFDVEGIDDQTFDINGAAAKPADPTKDQAIFGGWLLKGEAYDFATPVTEDITLTANWIDDTNKNGVADAEETITVTVVGNGTVEVTGATELALGTVDTTNYLFDSTKPEVKITATPVVAEGVSQSYVKTVMVGDQAAELTYGENFVATVELTAKGGDAITVTFEDTAFTYDEDGMLFFYSGIETPDPEKLYNAVITAPAYDKDKVTTIEYLARYQGEFTFTIPELFRLEIPIPGLSDIIIGNYDYTVDLNEEWLYVGEEFETVKSEDVTLMIEEKFAELKAKFEQIDLSVFEGIDWSDWKDLAGKISELTAAYNDIKGQVENLTAELEALIAEVTEQAKWIGYHQFGAMNDATIYDENNNVVETMRVVYKDNGKYLQDDNIKIHLYDDRETVTFANGDVSFEYDEYDNADLLAAVNLVDSKGNVVTVTGDKAPYIKLDMSGKDVGEYTYTVYFDGNNEYKPAADATFTLTVIKAPSSTDIVDVNITFGESYDGAPVITNKHGVQIDADVIEFILGLDVANLDLNENKNGIVGVNTVIQLMMPEELEGILGLLGLEEGATISLSDLIDLLGGADSLLGDLGLSGDATAPVEEALDYLVNIFDSYDLQIMLGGERPTNVGAYLHGAVALDSNYETSYDIGYILIAPKTTEHTLEWNTAALNNAVVTLPAFRNMDLGATAAGAKDMEVSYLFLGINNETGDIYSVDIYGDIKLNVWAYPENIKDNGAYVQMAYGIEWGNEFEYAIPIIRSFVIVPDVTKLDIIVDGQPSADLYKTVFDNAPVDVTVNGQIPEGGQVKLHYYGIEANTETYDSDIAPSHTGAYAITATLVTRDANGEMTSVGLDVATVVIQPTESAVTMKELETVTYDGQGHKVSEVMEIVASSTVENLKPDTTVITASIATDGSFSENGWAAAQGTVNVDFPRWMDELIAKYAPSVKDGITLSELEAKLLNKLPTITDKLEELGATNEMVNSTRNLLTNVSSLLDEMPADAVLSFKDDYEVLAVGTYAVAAVVTDSDHVPAAKAGVMVIVPSANQVYLDWEYHDENNIWSRDLLKTVSIGAIAYNDKEFTAINTEASKKITYQFIGLDQETGLKIYDNTADLPNGVYTQIAYIELDVESQIVLSDIIVRTIVIVPNMPELQIVNKNGAAQDKFEFTFDNAPVELYVKQNGQTIENQIRYIGLQTNGVEYDSTVPPVHAGAYAAITVLKTQENVGMDVALVTIAPAKSDISVTGGTVAYNGKKQTATVKAESPNSTVTSPDYTLISGTVDISAGVQNVGLESLCGDVNIDLPNWLDNVLAKTEFNRVDADVASVATFISEYRNDLLKLIPELMLESTGMSNETVEAMIQKLNGGIDELLKVLTKLPDDVNLTFESNKGYTELGSYFYYGIVTDSDHIPAADTGLLVIEPAEITSVDVTTEHVYDGKEQTATVVVKVGEVELPEDCYTVSGNVATEAGKYTVTVVGKGNYTGKVTADWAIEKASVTVTLNDKTKTYGEKDTDLTYTVNGLAVGDFAADLNIQATRKPGENVGEYAITATAKNANYNITIIDGTLTIEKADATVTINNASKVYGEEDPEFTATITGLKGDDKLNVVFSREAGQDVGEYVISATIAADDAVAKNYNITIKTGILTITQKDITTGDGYPIYFQPGDANGMIKVGTTVYVDDVAYILDENCVAWAADKNRELAIGYVYKNSGNHTTDHAYSDTTKNMYIWDLQWNEETKSYKADRVEELDNLLSFAGGSIWLGSDGVNGIRTYYSTTADTEAVKGAFRNLGYEVVTHGVVVGWADKLNGSEPVPNGNNSAAGHSAGNGTFYDEIYPAADKYITPDLRARFYVELKNIETSESKIIYSGSVERSIGYIAYQNIGRVDAQYQPYVKAILDKAAAAGFTYGG